MPGVNGYDSDAIRSDLYRQGNDPVIPAKPNRKVQRAIDKTAYAMRNRIECFFSKVKHSRRVAARYGKPPVALSRLRAACDHSMLDHVCPREPALQG